LPAAFSIQDLKQELLLAADAEIGLHGRAAVDGPAGAAFLTALVEYQAGAAFAPVLLKSQLLTALAQAQRTLSGESSLSEGEIRRYVAENYVSTSLTAAAAYYGLSPNYFSDLVKKKTGLSFIELVDEQKMEAAVRLLARPDLSIKQIIGLVGYRGKSFFYEKFGKYYGMSPAAKRKELFRQQGINL
ncbi:helix-turn-helix transcriptional regulator, partial [Lactobacillus nasalidis]